MKKFIYFVFIILLSLTSAYADKLKLIGVDKKGDFNLSSFDLEGVKSIQAFIGGSLKSFDPSLPNNLWSSVQPFISLKGGRGYWIILKDGYENKTFNFSGDPITIEDIKLNTDSNLSLVALPQNEDIGNVVNYINNKGYILKSIQAFIGGSLKSFDPSLPNNLWSSVQPFTNTRTGLGYWVVTNGFNSSSSNGLEIPPSPPGFDESGSSSSDDLMLPPSVPNF